MLREEGSNYGGLRSRRERFANFLARFASRSLSRTGLTARLCHALSCENVRVFGTHQPGGSHI